MLLATTLPTLVASMFACYLARRHLQKYLATHQASHFIMCGFFLLVGVGIIRANSSLQHITELWTGILSLPAVATLLLPSEGIVAQIRRTVRL